MAGRLLVSVTLLLSSWSAFAAPAPDPRKGDDFFIGVPVSNPDAQNIVPHRFIVVYNSTFDDDVITAHESRIKATIAKRNLGKRSPLTGNPLSTAVNTFRVGGWRGMALDADDRMITEIFTADEVSYVEHDVYVNINAQLTQNEVPSGLARISHAEPGATDYVFDDSAGEGITVFIVDTGIRVTHQEFEDRATLAANYVNDVVSLGSLGSYVQ